MAHALRVQALESFEAEFGGPPELLVRAPGRASLLGGHVDYNDGWVMAAAIDRSIWLAVRRRSDVRLCVRSLTLDERSDISLGPVLESVAGRASKAAVRWIDYPAGVAWSLGRAGYAVCGLDATVASDLPLGAGVGSSAALEVAFLLAWQTLGGAHLDRLELAQLGRQVENEYLGVQSGIQDQFASLMGETGAALFLDCRDHSWEALPLPAGIGVLVADSGVRRRLVEGGLNDRRLECRQAVERLAEAGFPVRALRDLERAGLEEARELLGPTLYRRARHVVHECERVQRGAALVKSGNLDALGELMLQSHQSSKEDYEVSIPELDTLVEAASLSRGCKGARLSGAGFGGCAVALVELDRLDQIASEVGAAFERRFGRRPTTFGSRLGPGASIERL